jgi:hypothetical protein
MFNKLPKKIEGILPQSRLRLMVYLITAITFLTLAFGSVLIKGKINFVVSDGRGYYVYLPSLVIDGDLDFTNQIQKYWDVDFSPALLEKRTETGLIPNKYPIGLALSIAPPFLLAHAASLLAQGVSASLTPDGYSLLYQIATLLWVMLAGIASFLLAEIFLIRELCFKPWAALFSVFLFWIGSNYAYYYFREPIMVHVISTFWTTLGIVLAWKLIRDKTGRTWWRIMTLGLALGLSIICRPTNAAILLPFTLPLLWRVRHRLLFGLPTAILPIVLQMATWKVLYGHWLQYSYGTEGFNWLEPQFISTLISSKHGLFFWSPLMVLSFLGFVFGPLPSTENAAQGEVRREFLARGLVAFILLWYVNSAWHNWWFGDAFGARAFLEIALFMIFGLALFCEGTLQSPGYARVLAGLIIGLCVAYNYALMALYISHRIPRADFLF